MSKPKAVTKERTRTASSEQRKAKRADRPRATAKAGSAEHLPVAAPEAAFAAPPVDPDDAFESLPEGTEADDLLDDALDELYGRVEGNGHPDEPEGQFEDYPWENSIEPPAGTDVEATAEATRAGSAARSPEPAPVETVPRLVEPSGTLIAHCGTRKITRAELALIPVPEATRTHQPLAHHSIIEALVESLAFRHIAVVREEYAVSPDGGRMFGVLDLDAEWSGVRFSIGLRNSNDKSMRLGMTVGYRVLVCDNMSFQGDFAPVFHKHTRKLDLLDVISIGVDKMQRGFAPLKAQIEAWRQRIVADDAARLIIYRAFLEDRFPRTVIAEVHRHYFQPEHEAFKPRTLWSLSNAFTSSFKLLKPVRQFTATAKLGTYLAEHAFQRDESTLDRLVA